MREKPELTQTKLTWAEEYFREHPGHSPRRGLQAMRRQFARGLRLATMTDLRRKVVGDKKITAKAKIMRGKKSKVKWQSATLTTTTPEPKAELPKKLAPLVADPDAWFQQVVKDFKNTIRDKLRGAVLHSMTINVDATGKWEIEYDLRRAFTNKIELQ